MHKSADVSPQSAVNESPRPTPFAAVCDALMDKWNGKIPRPFLEWLMATREIGGALLHASSASSSGVFDGLLEALDIQYLTGDADLKRIPPQGPAVLVANHPFGLLEGIILGSLLARVRPDYRFLANSLLGAVPEIGPYVLPVDPYGDPSAIPQNGRSLRNAMRWLAKGGLLVVFPAGEVSLLQGLPPSVKDRDWNQRVLEVARRSRAVVVPAYFKGRNSFVFQCAGFTHPAVRTALLARELVNKRGKAVEIAIGTPVRPEKLGELSGEGEMTAYLRQRTYSLAHRPSTPRARKLLPFRPTRPPARIASASDADLLEAEVNTLSPVFSKGEFAAYSAGAAAIPHALRELGRLREITFRAAGEGTGKTLDLDRFDQHYQHLFLWNHSRREIAGAYRIGDVDEILRRFGPNGLYSHTLFRFEREFLENTRHSLELGRSFIRAEYQKQPHSLSYLWKGIGGVLRQLPHKRYLFGPVSISENYGAAAQELLVSWFDSQNLHSAVKPRRPFRRRRGLDELVKSVKSVRELSDLVSDLQMDGKPMPVLLRHYLNLGGRVLAFNVDPDFSNTLDGLIVVDLDEAPQALLERCIGGTRDERPAA